MGDASRKPTGGGTLVGKTVGKYEIVRVIGKGGMGCVYEAINTAINKRVAMKCIDQELAGNDEANARFQREAVSASAVESPHIVQIFDAGSMDDGTPFIVMELLRGQDLGGYIAERGMLELDDTLQITAQILKGLHHAHEAGIVHRDLKPDNVFLVDREGEPLFVKVLDFGVSKIARSGKDVPLETLTRQGTVVGTPYYMSPEQAQAFPDVDGRTDIYSVGAIMYECLAARPPHSGQSYEQVIVNICMKDVPPVHELNPKVSLAVSKIVHTALSREREDRYLGAREMLEALVEVAPSSLRLSAPSGALRLPAGAAKTQPEGTRTGRISYPTEKQIITPLTGEAPSELAKTVPAAPNDEASDDGADEAPRDERTSSGVSAKTTAALSTVRSADLDDEVVLAGVPPRRGWLVGAVPVVIFAVVGGLYLGFGSTELRTASPTSNASSPTPTDVAPASAPEESRDETARLPVDGAALGAPIGHPAEPKRPETATSPAPEAPPIAKPLPKLPTPNTPQPRTPQPRTPQPKAPEPKAPQPKTPEPQTPEPKAPEIPKTPAPKPPSLELQEG